MKTASQDSAEEMYYLHSNDQINDPNMNFIITFINVIKRYFSFLLFIFNNRFVMSTKLLFTLFF
jgi:hypothetical protein